MGVAELKALLSETLARVKGGEEILVTEHGSPIARLVPLKGASPAEATQHLARSGLVRLPEKRLDEKFWKMPRARLREPGERDEDEIELPGQREAF
jgi:prevent-host-death family protein